MVNHYIYCQKNKIPFRLHSSNWLFRSNLGWNDYFEPIDTDNGALMENPIPVIYAGHGGILAEYSIREYKNVIPQVYRLNSDTIQKVEEAQKKLNLSPGSYCSIFVRRGCHLVNECSYRHASKYLTRLIEKVPSCSKLYVQTDDYNVITELREYILERSLILEVLTLCSEATRGFVTFSHYKQELLSLKTLPQNADYVKTLDYSNTKPVDQLSPAEMYDHTVNMLIGVELCRQSQFCVTDYESNVGRFIKLSMDDDKVTSAIDSELPRPNYDMLMCPGYCL